MSYASLIETHTSERARRKELGAFLRARREQLQPEDVGLERHGRRRVSGLRREEVAQLAFVSITWYSWLEQGRSFQPGGEALDSVCRALRLDDDATAYVRRLAGCPVTAAQPRTAPSSPVFLGLVEDLSPIPACLVTSSFDLVKWNRGYEALFGDPATLAPERRNLLWMSYFHDRLRNIVVDWPGLARMGVAALRAEAAARPGDPALRALISEICASSAEFRDAWSRQEVHRFHSERFSVHTELGTLNLEIDTLVPNNDASATIVVYYPTDPESRAGLRVWVAAESSTITAGTSIPR